MDNNIISISEAQEKVLNQFKSNLKDFLYERYTDELLIKFLRAKNFNLKAAEKIFKANYYNRLIFNINDMVDWYKKPEVARKYETLGYLGFAKDGSLIQYMGAGKLDFYGFIMSMSCWELCLYFSYIMEYADKLMKEEKEKTGRNINGITYIIDLDGFSIHQVLHKCVIEMGLDYTRLLQDCYPEIWSNILVVNAPPIFDRAFSIFKPVLRGPVLDKMRVLRKESSKQVLLEYIDEDVLPAFLGGNRVDSKGDPECKEFISFASKVPEKFFAINRSRILSPNDPGVKEIVIGPRSTYNHCEVITEGELVMKVEHRSESGSVTVTLWYRNFEPGENEVNAKRPAANEILDEDDEDCKYKPICVSLRSQTHLVPENLLGRAPWPGICKNHSKE